jgi:hypothetical protein
MQPPNKSDKRVREGTQKQNQKKKKKTNKQTKRKISNRASYVNKTCVPENLLAVCHYCGHMLTTIALELSPKFKGSVVCLLLCSFSLFSVLFLFFCSRSPAFPPLFCVQCSFSSYGPSVGLGPHESIYLFTYLLL